MSKLEYPDHLKRSFTEPNLKMLHLEETYIRYLFTNPGHISVYLHNRPKPVYRNNRNNIIFFKNNNFILIKMN